MFALANVIDGFADKLARLRGGGFSGSFVFTGAGESFFVRHKLRG